MAGVAASLRFQGRHVQPLPRLDPSLVQLCAEKLANDDSAAEYFKDLGLLPQGVANAPVAPAADGRGRHLLDQPERKFYGVCSQLGFNAVRPNCQGRVGDFQRPDVKRGSPNFRCTTCRKVMSQRNGIALLQGGAPAAGRLQGTFFGRIDRRGAPQAKIGYRAVCWIMYALCKDLTPAQTIGMIKPEEFLSPETVVDWRHYIREELLFHRDNSPPLGGPGQIVEIDESLFKGMRKYHRGRMLQGDAIPCRRNNNYGQRVAGDWVFGLVWKRPDGIDELRLFYVARRDRATLWPIITANVARGTLIRSDEWAAYQGLPNALDANGLPLNYQHETVNHEQFFVNPVNGANTQRIEEAWKDAKKYLLKLQNGTSAQLMDGHLAWYSWRSVNGRIRCHDTFLRLVDVLKLRYGQD